MAVDLGMNEFGRRGAGLEVLRKRLVNNRKMLFRVSDFLGKGVCIFGENVER